MFGDEKKYWLLPVFSRYAQLLMPYLLKLFNCQDAQGMGVVFVCFLKLDMVILISEKKKKTVLQSIFVSVALTLIFFQPRGWLLLPNLPC